MRKKYKSFKGSLIVEASAVVPICLICVCLCVLFFLFQYQKGIASAAVNETAAAAAAGWADSRTALDDGSWDFNDREDGLYEQLISSGLSGLFGSITGEGKTEEATTAFNGLDELKTKYDLTFHSEDPDFMEIKFAGIMASLASKMKKSILPPSRLRFKVSFVKSFPKDKLKLEILQYFDLPVFGSVSSAASTETLVGAPSDFTAGTDILLDIAKKLLPMWKDTGDEKENGSN